MSEAAPSSSPSSKTQGWKKPLHDAVWNRDLERVKELVSQPGADLEATELDMQPLNLSVIKDHAEIARVLLEAGAKVDGGDTPALFTACALEKIELVRLLLKHGASLSAEDKKQKIAAIHITADKGYLEIMKLLLAAKANPNLRSSEGKMTPLHYAASCGRTELVSALISAGSDVNAQNVSDNTPLLMACNKGHTDTVRELLKHKADMTIFGKPDGLTALHAAVVFGGAEGFVDTAALLIDAGAPINLKSQDGMLTPLHCSSAKGHVACVKLLIQKGADIHALDKFNSTPLRIAASNANSLENLDKFRQVAELLLKAGADINAASAAGNTPLHSIVKLGDVDLIRWMLDNGADAHRKNNEGLAPVDHVKSDDIRQMMEKRVPPPSATAASSAAALNNNAAAAPLSPKGPSSFVNPAANGSSAALTTSGQVPPRAASPQRGGADKHADKDGDGSDDEEAPGVFTKRNWVKDEDVSACQNCNSAFTLFNRRHHCRHCGKIFCAKCSNYQTSFKGLKKPVRVDIRCYNEINGKK
jgi:ankyrin repeat protein